MAQRNWLKYVPTVLTIVVFILAVAGAFLLKKLLFKEQVDQKKQVQQITIIAPPPPPPPPKEIEEPEVEEEIIEEEEVVEEIPEESAEPPPGDLGLDSEGVAGGDNFGLVGRPGGRGLFGAGSSYGALVERELDDMLQRDRKLRGKAFYFIIELLLDNDGGIEQFEITQKKGDESLKEHLRTRLLEFGRFSQAVPLEANNSFRIELDSSRT